MRKITLAAGAALLVVGPVSAASRRRPRRGPPMSPWLSPEDGARLQGEAVHIKAKVGFYGGVKSWAVEVLAPEDADYPGYGTICEGTESRAPASVNIDCVWDTTAYPDDGGQAQNRPYVVRIQAHPERNSGGPHSEDRGVIVSNPVSAPRDVRLGFVESTRQATVRWRPTPSPTSSATSSRSGSVTGPGRTSGRPGAG